MELGLVFNWVIKSSIMASILAVLILLVKYALRNKPNCAVDIENNNKYSIKLLDRSETIIYNMTQKYV